MRTQEQKRALFACEKINEINEGIEEKKKKEYRSKIVKMPAMIQTCGLVQTIAFYESKKEIEKKIIEVLKEWMGNQENQFRLSGVRSDKGFSEILAALDFKTYRKVTREIMAFSIWLKRIAEAIFPE